MASSSELLEFKNKAMGALEYAEDLKSKLIKTNEKLSEGSIINGRGFCTDQFQENIKKVETICTNLNEIITYCASNIVTGSGRDISAIKGGILGANKINYKY